MVAEEVVQVEAQEEANEETHVEDREEAPPHINYKNPLLGSSVHYSNAQKCGTIKLIYQRHVLRSEGLGAGY